MVVERVADGRPYPEHAASSRDRLALAPQVPQSATTEAVLRLDVLHARVLRW